MTARQMNQAEQMVCELGMAVFGLLLKEGWEPQRCDELVKAAFADAFPSAPAPVSRIDVVGEARRKVGT